MFSKSVKQLQFHPSLSKLNSYYKKQHLCFGSFSCNCIRDKLCVFAYMHLGLRLTGDYIFVLKLSFKL